MDSKENEFSNSPLPPNTFEPCCDLRNENFVDVAAKVFKHIDLGFAILDPVGVIASINSAFTVLTGYAPEDVIGKNYCLLQSERQRYDFCTRMWAALKTQKSWRGIILNQKKDGTDATYFLSVSKICDADLNIIHYAGVFSDIALPEHRTRRLEHLAHYDPLTKLPNRLLLSNRLRWLMAYARKHQERLAVCYLDLDNFKPVNDKLGHLVGDELLILAVQRMRHCLRDSDVLARLGGDEFILLLPDLTEEFSLENTLNRLLETLAIPFNMAEHVIKISASIGVTFYPDDSVNSGTLISHADHAMYEAKHSGGNRFQIFIQ